MHSFLSIFGSLNLINLKVSILKDLIKVKGYRQKWLAEKLGVSEVTLSNWANNKVKPNEENLKRLSDIFDTPIERLR
ncbi:MAG TPA: helix-turn-helix transcriptional regulator [Bacteroidales bacterium]|nr:helix-turn-helix transcriptional regulator [Bacteroidales bacterium]